VPIEQNIAPFKSKPIRLRCPECDLWVLVESADLVENRALQCPSCAADLVVTREWNDHEDVYNWLLVTEVEALPDEPQGQG
jgi:uncharacterized paraquat-inducible protein A